MKADNIKNIISDIDHLPYRAILFDGTWGIGKSYAVNEALEANPNVCKISMFGLKDTRQIYHEALFQLALKNNIGGKIGEIANNILDGASKIWDKVGQAKEAVQSIVNEREMFLLLSKEFTSVHIIVIDDLERMSDDINLEDILGIIEELKQCNYVKVIVIANTDEENKEMMKFLIETYVGYLKKTTHGKKAYEYSYKLRNNFDSSYYHDIIISEIDNLYNKISFPVDNVDEDRYHTCYNIMYVLYHSDAEKFLQYCEKIKEDCDNMSRHRIEVLVEEIVKK